MPAGPDFAAVRRRAIALQEETVADLGRLVSIPSFSGREERVVRWVEGRMRELDFDEVRVDPFGNVLGRIGDGPRVLAFDAHLDTVEVTDAELWRRDPLGGDVADGHVHGRGAVDQKAGMAAMLAAGRIIRELDLARGCQVWLVGSVLEEDCDGLCWHYILSEGVLRPELVVSTEPTGLAVFRGQRGRLELRVSARGRSAHGSMPERGENAIYKLAPAVGAIADLNGRLAEDPFLGKGTCTVTWISGHGPSLCAVPDHAELHVDRRLTAGEDLASAVGELEGALAEAGVEAEVRVPVFERPSWTGLVYPMEQYYPTWTVPADSPPVRAALRAGAAVLDREPPLGRWTFSTNGVAIMGLHGVPCVGFGPGREQLAHSRDEKVPVADLVAASALYAALPAAYLETAPQPPAG